MTENKQEPVAKIKQPKKGTEQYVLWFTHRTGENKWEIITAYDEAEAIQKASQQIPQAGQSVVLYRRVKRVERKPGPLVEGE